MVVGDDALHDDAANGEPGHCPPKHDGRGLGCRGCCRALHVDVVSAARTTAREYDTRGTQRQPRPTSGPEAASRAVALHRAPGADYS